MNLRHFARMLANDQVIEKLANTPLMRRLAQLTHYAYRRATFAGQKKIDEFLTTEERMRFAREKKPIAGPFKLFVGRFLQNVQRELEKANKLGPK